MEQNSRKYNIDIASAMILAGGEIVDVLANSGLGQYCQFYPMVQILLHINLARNLCIDPKGQPSSTPSTPMFPPGDL